MMTPFSVNSLPRLCRLLLSALFVVALLANGASAEDIVVTTDADSGAGSLREALTAAASGDRIVFDIAGTPTIVLLSDLPTVNVDISFANNNVPDVTIDRNGFGPLSFTGPSVDPSVLVINTGGSASADADIVASAATTVFGAGSITGNVTALGTLAPGADSAAGTVGTLSVTGDVDVSNSQLQLDLDGGAATSDLLNVSGTATVTGATLVPNFIGNEYTIGQQFLVLDATAISGAFANQADTFQLPDNPFLQAIADATLTPDDFGFVIEDNGLTFQDVVNGCNQTSAARVLDDLLAGAPPASVTALREASTAELALAVNQISGSVYPSLIGAEINHIHNNMESVRDLIVLNADPCASGCNLTPWVRGYGVSGQVDQDDCNTLGYRQRIGGVELGCGLGGGAGLTGHIFSHLASGSLDVDHVDQRADVDSYRLGGSILYAGQHVYMLAAAGAGTQEYDVRRSLVLLQGSSFAESSFDGSARYGYFEVAFTGAWAPYLAMQFTRVEIDPITETGDPVFALSNSGGSSESYRGILGWAYSKSAPTALGLATTRLRFGWTHEYGDEFTTIVSQVAGGNPAIPLTDQGVASGRDWGFVRIQLEWGQLLGGQLTGSYQGQFNTRSYYSSLLGGAAWTF